MPRLTSAALELIGRVITMTPQQHRWQTKRMPLQEIQSALQAESGTPWRQGHHDRLRRYLLLRRLDRVIRHEAQRAEAAKAYAIKQRGLI